MTKAIEEEAETMAVEQRHTAVLVITKINNFIAWALIVLIVTAPLGISMLLFGHLVLMQRETEENTREIVTMLRGSGMVKGFEIART